MSINTPNSVIASWVLLIARMIDSHGLSSRDLFHQVGPDYDEMNHSGSRYSYAAVYRLWNLVAEKIPDPCIGMQVAALWHPTTLHALGYSWMASHNLDEAYQRTIRYGRFLNSAVNGVLKIEQSADTYGLVIDTDQLNFEPPQVSQEAGLSLFLNLSRAAYGPSFQPLGVSLKRPPPDCLERFCKYFDTPVSFSQSGNALWLANDQVIEPLVTANPELTRVNDQVVTDYLANMDREDVVTRVRKKITECLPSGRIEEADVAESINMSQRSLQRKLHQQSQSFVGLLEETRRDLSREYVRDPHRSINEIAYLLGFAEPGNFSRAFKRWYGLTPTSYRQQQLM